MKKLKILFILPPHASDFFSFKDPSWGIIRIPPFSLISLGSYLYGKGYTVKIVDCRELIYKHKTNNYIPFLLEIVNDFRPEVVGINILTALFYEARRISFKLKSKFPDITLIVGGPHPSVEPLLTFKQNQYIDAICIGPGEEVCLDILSGKIITNIPGLMHREYIENFIYRSPEIDIDKFPFPNYDLVNKEYYTDFTLNTLTGWGFKGIATLTSRSCPYSCKFCASDWSKPFRYHSADYVISLAKYLSTYKIDAITFIDDTLAAIKERLNKICEGFIREKIFWPYSNLRWFAAIRANQADPDILKQMKDAGCFGVSVGIESGSDRMLKVLNKITTVEMNKRAYKYINEAGLYLGASFMLGIPGETYEDMCETIAFIKETNSNSKGLGIFRPLPGSPFYDEFIKKTCYLKKILIGKI